MAIWFVNIDSIVLPINDLGIELLVGEKRKVFEAEDDQTNDFNINDLLESVDSQKAVIDDKLLLSYDGLTNLTKEESLNLLTETNVETLYDFLVWKNNYTEILRSGNFVTDIIVWTDLTKTIKIKELNITRSNGLISQIVTKQYDVEGLLETTQTETVNRTGFVVDSIEAVVT